MDIFLPIVLLIIFCILFSICGWCCKRHKAGIVYGRAPPAAGVSQLSSTPGNIPPYPPGPHMPQAVNAPTGIGFMHQPPYPTAQPGYQITSYQPMYPAVPYGFCAPPANMMGPVPYPPVGAAPYPPGAGQLPPPYHEVVGQSPPTQPYNPPLAKEVYSQQPPYNPGY